MINVSILGPLLMRVAGEPIAIRGARTRSLLALLVQRRNRSVRIDEVISELWRDLPPSSATPNVRTHVSALRAYLGPARDRVVTAMSGYTLQLKDEELDFVRFERVVADARSLLRCGEVHAALERYRHGLAMWRGDPLQDVPLGPRLQVFATMLADAWIAAREGMCEAARRVGDARQSIAWLHELVADFPTRESSWYLLIDALYQAGERAHALEAYDRLREVLASELGVEPGWRLADLRESIVRGARPTTC